jgi:hypothetical protein
MKRGRKQYTLGSSMVLVAVCAVALAYPELFGVVLVVALMFSFYMFGFICFAYAAVLGPLSILDYVDRRRAVRADRTGPRQKAADRETSLVANRIEPSTGQVM